MKQQGLADKVVVITGASSGFGKGAARRFAEEGAHVVLAARRGDLIEDVARACASLGVRALAVPADVSRRTDVERIAQTAVTTLGRMDIWINNAGVGAVGPFQKIPLDDHEQVIGTNLLGTLYGSYVAYRHFLERREGILMNVASELGRHTAPYYASYAAAKHAVVGLSDALRQEVWQQSLDDIHICTVMPTAHDTPFFDHVANYTGHEVQPPTPLHDPDNVVETLVALARDPRDREIVGGDGVVKILMKNLMPGLTEKLAAKQIHREQMEKAPPGPDSPGAVQQPTPIGTDVSAGRREGRKPAA